MTWPRALAVLAMTWPRRGGAGDRSVYDLTPDPRDAKPSTQVPCINRGPVPNRGADPLGPHLKPAHGLPAASVSRWPSTGGSVPKRHHDLALYPSPAWAAGGLVPARMTWPRNRFSNR